MNFETANLLKPGDRVIHTTSLLVGRVAVRIPGSMLSLEFPGGLRHYDMHAMGPYQPYVENPSPTKETPCTKPPASTDGTPKPQPTTPSLSPAKDSTPRSPAKQGTTWKTPSPGSARGSAEPIDDLAGVPDALLRQQVLAAMTSDLTSIYDLVDKFPHGTPHQRIFRLALELVDSGEVERMEDRRGPCYRLKPAEHVAPPDPPTTPNPKEASMAKRKRVRTDDDQMQLIETDTPEGKVGKKLLAQYQLKVEEHQLAGEKRDDARKALVDWARKNGRSNSEGITCVSISGIDIIMKPDEKVTIKPHAEKAEKTLADDIKVSSREGADADEPQLQTRDRR